jgi:hypothetical protein
MTVGRQHNKALVRLYQTEFVGLIFLVASIIIMKEDTDMAKTASQRRFDKRAVDLGALYASNPEKFARVWEQYVRSWLGEVSSRTRAQREGDNDQRRLLIFEVLAQAQKLAQAAGVQSRVGSSLKVLEHECAKAVASLADPRLYLFNEDCTSRIAAMQVHSRTSSK